MSVPIGNFDCAALQLIQVEIDRQWPDAQANTVDNISETIALQAIRNNQTARFAELEGQQDKDRQVKIWWLADCAEDIEETCDDRCDLGGPQPEADCRTYSVTKCIKRGFSIPHNQFRTSNLTREQLMAYNIMRKMKAIEEQLAREVIDEVYSFRGVNKSAQKPGVVSGSDTYILPPYWDENLNGYFTKMSILNRMRNSYLLNGNNFYDAAWRIEMEQSDPKGASAKRKLNALPMINDLFNIDQQIGSPATLMIAKNATAIVNTFRYSSTPMHIGTKFFYSIASKNLPWLTFDVGIETVCVGNDFQDDVSLWATWDIFQNPLPCDPEMTGILSFLCGEP